MKNLLGATCLLFSFLGSGCALITHLTDEGTTTTTTNPPGPGSSSTAAKATLSVQNSASVVADGNSAATLVLKVVDSKGNAVADQNVTFALTTGHGTLTPAAGTTASDGTLNATLTSTRAESKVVTATVDSLTPTATVLFVAGPADELNSSLLASAATAAVGTTVTFYLTVQDAHGNAISGANAVFSVVDADGYSGDTGNALNTAQAALSATGTASTLFSATRSGIKNVTATVNSFSLATQVQYAAGAPNPSTSNFVASNKVVAINGTDVFTLNLRDSYNNPVANSNVTFSGDIDTISVTTDATGIASTTQTLSSAGIFTVYASYGESSWASQVRATNTVACAGTTIINQPPWPALTGTSYSLVSADFNGDSKADLAVDDFDNNKVSLYLGNGGGTLATPLSLTTDSGPVDLATADFNGDSLPDIVTANNDGDSISIILNSGGGFFASAVTYSAASSGPEGVAVANLGGDSTPDVAICNDSGTVDVFINNGDGTFGSAITSNTAPGPLWIAAADLNNDGHMDLVTSNSQDSNNSVAVLLGDSNGYFAAPIVYPIGSGAQQLIAAQLNFATDDIADIAVVSSSGTVSVLLGTGHSASPLHLVATLNGGTNPEGLVAADYNGDSKNDLLLTNGTFFAGNGNAQFQTATTPVTINGGGGVAVDLNGDAKMDLATVSDTPATLDVLLGNNAGSFNWSISSVTTQRTPSAVVTDDFDADGNVDIAVSNDGNNSASAALNNGNGTFQTPTLFTTGSFPSSIASGDLDDDGYPDLVTTNSGTDTLSLALGDGFGNFGPATTQTVGTHPSSLVMVDINDDNFSDLVVTNGGDGTLTVLISKQSSGASDSPPVFNTPITLPAGDTPVAVINAFFTADFSMNFAVANSGTVTGNTSVTFYSAPESGAVQALGQPIVTSDPPVALAAVDFNNDGKDDLAIVCSPTDTSSAGSVLIYISQGDGTFVAGNTYPVLHSPNSVTITDINNDGLPDLAVTNNGDNAFSLLYGKIDGTFQTPVTYYAGPGPVAITSTELVGSSDSFDLVIVDATSRAASVLKPGACY